MDAGRVRGSAALESHMAIWFGDPDATKADPVTVDQHGALAALPQRIGTWDLRRVGGRQPLNALSDYGLPDSLDGLDAWLAGRS